MARFRTGIINWPGEWVLFSGSGGGLYSRISSSNVIPKKVKEREVTQLCPTLWTPWTVAYQDPQSMEFSRQEYWSGLSFPSPGDLPSLGVEPRSPALQTDTSLSEPPGKPHIIPKGQPI